jgi:hypothetical protein
MDGGNAKSHKSCPQLVDVNLDGGEVRLRLSSDIDDRDAAGGYAALTYV